jgi:hypothetical protein
MTMPSGYTFVGKKSYPNSIKWASWFNQYCNMYKYNGLPLDARYVAAVISAEDASWNPTQGSLVDYSTTGSIGLGQFTNSTGPSYGINTLADKENPEKNIKAICNYFSGCMVSAHGNVALAYEMYNGGQGIQSELTGFAQAKQHEAQNFAPALAIWDNYSAIKKIGTSPTPALKNNNTNALKDTQNKANEVIDNNKIKASRMATQLAKEKALKLSDALKKAKLTKNPIAIKKAQLDVNTSKITPTKSTTPISSTPKKILQGGMSIIGIIATVVILKNGYDL